MKELYILDTSVIRFLFEMYYFDSSPEIFKGFEVLLETESLTSVKEVLRELERQNINEYETLIIDSKNFFEIPTSDEVEIIKDIYSKSIYRNSIKEKTIREGRPFADPFLIAKGVVAKGIVVTAEKADANPSKIPNICDVYGVKHINFEEFIKVLREIGDKNI